MNADPQLRERLDRAASNVRVDVDERLDALRASAPRRQRVRRGVAVGIAAVLVLGLVAVVWQLRPLGDHTRVPGGTVGPTGRIAVMRLTKPLTHRETSELFVVDASSGEISPLHEGPGFTIVPQWSSDGTRVAYVSNEVPGGAYGIFVARADGADPVNILGPEPAPQDGGPIDLSWSPDGSRIAYVGRTRAGATGVWIVGADGSDDRMVLVGQWESVSWSPDGSRLLLGGHPESGPQGARYDVFTVKTDGTRLDRLTDDKAIERWPTWSPDGSEILFAERTVDSRNPDYGQDVFVMDADGSNIRRLTAWRGFDSFAVWSPDGEWIAFASDRDATPEQRRSNGSNHPFSGVSVYVMRADGSDVHRVADGGDVALLPSSWAP